MWVRNTKFDVAMVAFLDCLKQLKDAIESGGGGFCLPYDMENGKITDRSSGKTFSVKTQFNSLDKWSEAMKLMLTNLKWAISWVNNKYSNND